MLQQTIITRKYDDNQVRLLQLLFVADVVVTVLFSVVAAIHDEVMDGTIKTTTII